MIISRTPFRVSFFGGGTDYPAWFKENGGAVLATSINKYCYITCRYLPPFFEHKYRIAYAKLEHASDVEEIQHPAVREALKYMQIDKGVEIHYDADLPARSGLGSSSSFAVGLLHVLYALTGRMPDKMKLAMDAIHVEQQILKENVGCQDQVVSAFGGMNVVSFNGSSSINLLPLTVSEARKRELLEHLILCFSGLVRTASDIAKDQIENISIKKEEITAMHQLVFEAVSVLNSGGDISEFGKLLHESWMIKRSLSSKISNDKIDEIYETGRKAGATGGKLLGAGGGGFLLLFAEPDKHPFIREALKNLLFIPFDFEQTGSTIIFYQPDSFS
jgi:D-glycero-alpha-D-manno-heptose-7-phosphate kinase